MQMQIRSEVFAQSC